MRAIASARLDRHRQVLLSTGMRLGELMAIQASDVSNDAVILRDTKSGYSRVVPLPRDLRHIAFPVKTFRKAFNTAVHNAGLTGDTRTAGVTRHPLRHTCATRLASRGLSPFLIAKLLGHRSIATTAKYSHLDVEDIRALVSAGDGRRHARL